MGAAVNLGGRFPVKVWLVVAPVLAVATLTSACISSQARCQAAESATVGGTFERGTIAFRSSGPSPSTTRDTSNICLVHPDGSQTRLTHDDLRPDQFEWSPDGSRIAFLASTFAASSTHLHVMKADGSVGGRLTDATGFAWSPDGTRIAFASRGDIYVIDPDGANEIRLTFDPARDFSPSWAPDGFQIAFLSNRDDGLAVYVTYVDDPSAVRLPDTFGVTDEFGGIEVEWSPDGSHLTSAISSYSSVTGSQSRIRVIDADGERKAQFDGSEPAWSPDGNRIAFVSEGDIRVIDADGSNEVTVTEDSVNASPAWSPDGSQIAFSSSGDIYVMNADGSGERNITNSPDATDSDPAWAPH